MPSPRWAQSTAGFNHQRWCSLLHQTQRILDPLAHVTFDSLLELDGCHLSTETQKQPMLFSSLAKNPGCRIHHVMVETLRLLEKWTLQSLVLMRKDFLLLYQGLEIAIHCCLSSKHMSEAEKWNFSILGEFIPKNIIGDKGGYDTLQTERYQRQKTKQRLPKNKQKAVQ